MNFRFLETLYTSTEGLVIKADLGSALHLNEEIPGNRNRGRNRLMWNGVSSTQKAAEIPNQYPIRPGLDTPRDHHISRHGNRKAY